MKDLVSDLFETLFGNRLTGQGCQYLPLQVTNCAIAHRSAVMQQICHDLDAQVERDPAVMGEALLVLVPNGPFIATLCYRLAHDIWRSDSSVRSRQIAMSISHYGRVLSGAEIHPLQGFAVGVRPPFLDLSRIRAFHTISPTAARDGQRQMARDLGFFLGVTSGANYAAARKVSANNPNALVVTLAYDSGESYLRLPQGDHAQLGAQMEPING